MNAQPRRFECGQVRLGDAAASNEGRIERAGRRPDQQIGRDPSGGEGLEHAYLNRSKAPATRQDEGGGHANRQARTAGLSKTTERRASVSAASSNPKSRRAMS